MQPTRPDEAFAVCVFAASSGGLDPAYVRLARDVGEALARQGWRLVYGGGQVGLMGELAHAALAAGGGVTGVIPHQLNSREVAFDDIDDLVVVDSLAERKAVMDRRSDAFVTLPGGIGTLDELLEMLTTRHLGYHRRPILLVDPDGYWTHFRQLLDHMVDTGTLGPDTVEALTWVSDAEAMVAALAEGR